MLAVGNDRVGRQCAAMRVRRRPSFQLLATMTEGITKYRHHQNLFLGVLIFTGTVALYWQAIAFDYINIDDPDYVARNYILRQGFSKETIAWAFTTTQTANWHPVTWLSYLMDIQLFGASARVHHAFNIVLHALNAVLVNIVLRRLTGAAGLSLIVALLFAVHPLNMESVIWIAERKNVLSTLFWLLVMWCYAIYTETQSVQFYLAALTLFALGLMAKPMLVTLPCALLLIDFWPLNRFCAAPENSDRRSLSAHAIWLRTREKIPFFMLTAVSCIVTFRAQAIEGAVKSLDAIPLGMRLTNALVSYVVYLQKLVWPHPLAIFYPYPSQYPWWQPLGAFFLLAAGTYLALRTRKRHPFILFGWFWYLGTLVPVIGLVQVGSQAMADRYAYIPALGVFVAITWGAHAFIRQRGIPPAAAATAAGLAILGLGTVTGLQTRHWQNSKTLLQHATRVTQDNYVAHNNLGGAYAQSGQFDIAARHYAEALRAKPDHWKARNNLGLAMEQLGQPKEALDHYFKALEQNPDYAEAHNNIGSVMAKKGQWDEAVKHYRRAIQIDARFAAAHNNLAAVLAQNGQLLEAQTHYAAAVEIDPYLSSAVSQLALIQLQRGQIDEARKTLDAGHQRRPQDASIAFQLGRLHHLQGDLDRAAAYYQKTLRLAPQNAEALNDLATIYFQQKAYDRALELFLKLARRFPAHPETHYNVACSYARLQQVENALDWLRKAIDKGYRNWEKIKTDPDLANIRQAPAYQALIRVR